MLIGGGSMSGYYLKKLCSMEVRFCDTVVFLTEEYAYYFLMESRQK
jgi:hypothetical protein